MSTVEAFEPRAASRLAHSGASMAPTLVQGDVLALERVDGSALRPGDVVAFTRPQGGAAVVHRVVARTAAGLVTRGDAVPSADPATVAPQQVLGRVAQAWRGERRIAVRRGALGLVQARTARWRTRLRAAAARRAAPLRPLLPPGGWAAPLLPGALRPRVVCFGGAPGERRLLVGKVVAGRYDSESGAWRVRLLFRPFVRASALARVHPS